MKALCSLVGITPQAHSKEKQRFLAKEKIEAEIVSRCAEKRINHREMGCRKLYDSCLKDLPLGRDKCEKILFDNGFRVKFPKNYYRTTESIKEGYFPNLIKGITVTGPDQVWQSDITYIRTGDTFYYAAFIIDVYTKCVVGASVADNMKSSLVVKAIKRAYQKRSNKDLSGLIFHSDRGSQYIAEEVQSLLRKKGIKQSMCLEAWENAYAERINGTIKNEYIRYAGATDLRSLTRKLAQAVKLYNEDRIHLNLPQKMTPKEFEEKFIYLSSQERPIIRLYTEEVVLPRGIEPLAKTAKKGPQKPTLPKDEVN